MLVPQAGGTALEAVESSGSGAYEGLSGLVGADL